MRVRLLPPALLALLIPTINALTLSDFQPVNGFSSQCTQAYNTPLQGCSQSDFQNGHACSSTCITFLEALTKMLNTDCKGTSAFPNTLIGLFFSQQGTSTLCPNVLGSSGGEGGDQASYAAAASRDRASFGRTSQQISATVAPTTSTNPSVPSFSSSSSDTATSSTVVIAQTTVTPSKTPTSRTPLATAPASSASSSSSLVPQPSSKGKDSHGGGGTILDVGSTAAGPSTLILDTRSWVLIGASVMLAWLF